jgi:DNA polymerase III alpha subunit (gram-positive type)
MKNNLKLPTIVIYDTEWTSWPRMPKSSTSGQHRELIQIAARKWTLGDAWQNGEMFNLYIKPQINPTLSPFIKRLTGIKQSQVDRAPAAHIALKKFAKFVGAHNAWSNGNDINVLAETAGLQKFILPVAVKSFFSLQPDIFLKIQDVIGFFNWKEFHSGNLYKLLKIKLPTDDMHNAMHDVDSLCATINRLQELGIDMSYLWKSNPPNDPNNFKLSPKNLKLYEQQKTSKN